MIKFEDYKAAVVEQFSNSLSKVLMNESEVIRKHIEDVKKAKNINQLAWALHGYYVFEDFDDVITLLGYGIEDSK